jgi:Lrp/AsnC family transcriptional regulator for asnA, asnC and gidA
LNRLERSMIDRTKWIEEGFDDRRNGVQGHGRPDIQGSRRLRRGAGKIDDHGIAAHGQLKATKKRLIGVPIAIKIGFGEIVTVGNFANPLPHDGFRSVNELVYRGKQHSCPVPTKQPLEVLIRFLRRSEHRIKVAASLIWDSTRTLIAKEVGVSESTVRNRLRRLVDQGLVGFDITTDPYRFGYEVWTMLEIRVELPRIRAVAEHISREPRVHMVGITTGAYDIFAAAVVRSNQDLVELITNRLSKIPGITAVSSSTILEVVKRNVNFGFPPGSYV